MTKRNRRAWTAARQRIGQLAQHGIVHRDDDQVGPRHERAQFAWGLGNRP
jgi:hypothetical protein